MNTLQMEIAVMRHCDVSSNIVVPNVSFGIKRYIYDKGVRRCELLHECDILKLTPSGYATEYEIKVSNSDFMADFKKGHGHDSPFIKQFYYAVPFRMLDFAKENLPSNAGLIYVQNGLVRLSVPAPIRKGAFKWTDDETLKLARLGTMRILGLKKNINKIKHGTQDRGNIKRA